MRNIFATNRILRRNTAQLLLGLGNRPGEIARSLDFAKVRGVALDPSRCAVAEYLAAIVRTEREVRDVKVLRYNVVITTDHWLGRTVVPLPKAIREFIRNFDEGVYPWLFRTAPPPTTAYPATHGRDGGVR